MEIRIGFPTRTFEKSKAKRTGNEKAGNDTNAISGLILIATVIGLLPTKLVAGQ
jgi:hypothetical protein